MIDYKTKYILYDFDGVLADSLSAHIKFLKFMNVGLELKLELPDVNDIEACRKIVKSPMEEFIRGAGFPDYLVNWIDWRYKKIFSEGGEFEFGLFEGVSEGVKELREMGFIQGIVSSNYKENISHELAKNDIAHYFDWRFGREELERGSKFLTLLKLKNSFEGGFCYVGDMEGDYVAAKKAGMTFIGTSYGWGFDESEKRFPVARNPEHLKELIMFLD